MAKTILIAGGSGLIGTRLRQYLDRPGIHFNILSRSEKRDTDQVTHFLWDPSRKEIDTEAFDGVDTVVNLAGAGIADKRWTKSRKAVLVNSRLDSAATLAKGLVETDLNPKLLISASAIGYYGDQGPRTMTEADPAGRGFLADVTKAWEEASASLAKHFQRSAVMRIGIVLSTQGGALKEMIKPTALGIYGYFGKGDAYYSWIHIDDICQLIDHLMQTPSASGTYNATAPVPVTIKALIKSLRTAQDKSGLVLPVPTLALKLALGEMTHMLTDSMRVAPERLMEEGFPFLHPELVPALEDILEKAV